MLALGQGLPSGFRLTPTVHSRLFTLSRGIPTFTPPSAPTHTNGTLHLLFRQLEADNDGDADDRHF